MADIDLYQDDCEDPQDDDFGPVGSWMDTGEDAGLGCDDGEACNPDDLLTPLQKMEKYMDSEHIFSRQMVARSLMETLRAVGDNPQEATAVLANMVRLAEDSESTVRADLMEQVPHLAMYCQENKMLVPNAVPTYILPIITRYLVDSHNQVRKTSQAALLVLLEQELVDRGDFEKQVCPVILDLSNAESIDDFRTEAVALMSKMAPLVGKDITERIFMPRFAEMCTDALFHVRKVCAANFGEMCTVVGIENVQRHLLSKFVYLCEDGVWGVRKACAECFMEVSCACSLEVRKAELAALFVNLIADQSRWVRMGAFQALGGFISTFADPANTGLYFNDDGILVAGNPHDFAKKLAEDHHPEAEQLLTELIRQQEGDFGTTQQTSSDLDPLPMDLEETPNEHVDSSVETQELSLEERRAEVYQLAKDICEPPGAADLSVGASSSPSSLSQSTSSRECDIHSDIVHNEDCDSTGASDSSPEEEHSVAVLAPAEDKKATSESSKQPIHVHLHNATDEYNNFNFWRTPLPEVDVDLEIVDGKPTAVKITTRVQDESHTVKTTQVSVDVPGQLAEVTEALDKLDVADQNPDQAQASTTTEAAPVQDQPTVGEAGEDEEVDERLMHTAAVSTVSESGETVTNIGSTHVLGQHVNETTMSVINGIVQDISGSSPMYSSSDRLSLLGQSGDEASEDLFCSQDVIPQALLDHYLSMSDPTRAQTVDADIARHCAYSLPAVAYTLGRKFWPCLKGLYETLASDMQWKVRRTLAFSIHEMAVIVGEEITAQDLVPVFNEFLKDLDEVRIGVLKHLADFLALLKQETRQDYLTKIPVFLDTDNNRNWRFREELGTQLLLLIDLYSAEDISKHLLPIALQLAEDRVAEVRIISFKVLAGMLRRISEAGQDVLVSTFINDIINRFSASKKWCKRQIFAQLCHQILEASALPPVKFATMLLPSLLALGTDPTPNVRISLASAVAAHLVNSDYFTGPQNPHHEDLLSTIKRLQADSDRDVRYIMSGEAYSSWFQSQVVSGFESAVDMDDMAMFFDPSCIEEAVCFS